METKFINRKKEFEFLKKIISNDCCHETGRIVFLYSRIGLGKARLVSEFIAKYYPISLKFDIKIPMSKNLPIQPYYYFNSIYSQIKDYLFNYSKFKLTSEMSISFKAFSIGFSLERETELPRDIIKKIKQIQKFFRSYKQNIIISIENFQSIDIESLEIIKSLLKEFSNILIFLQYTIDDYYTKSNLQSLFDYLYEFSICKHPLEIKKMEPEHVRKIVCEINNIDIKKSSFFEYYIKYDGNIDELIICLLEENNEIYEISYEEIIKEKLSTNARFLLFVILFYGSEIYKDTLLKILVKIKKILWNYSKIEKFCAELEQYHIINIENEKLILNNSIINYLEEVKSVEEAFVAFRIVEEYCYNELLTGDSKNDSLFRLIYLYFLFNDERIITLLPYIKERLINAQSINQVLDQIESISKSGKIDLKLKQKLILGIVDILYAIGNMSMARKKLDTIFQKDNLQHEMYNLALKGLLNELDFASYYNELFRKYKSQVRIELFCEYMMLYHKMKYESSTTAKKYAQKLLRTKQYKNYLEYYFILKNFSTYLNNNEAIIALQQCINVFESQKRKDLAIRTKVTLAMRIANIGDLMTARKILKEAENENIYSCREYYFLNNISVIDILEGNISDEVESNLKNALLFLPTQYEKGIILCNLLIYYCEMNDLKNAKDIVAQLEMPQYYQYEFEQYRHIIHYNLYFYYCIVNDSEKKKFHFNKLKNLYQTSPLELKEYMNATIFHNSSLLPGHRRYFYSKYPYRPDYIGYWQLEVPDFSSE